MGKALRWAGFLFKLCVLVFSVYMLVSISYSMSNFHVESLGSESVEVDMGSCSIENGFENMTCKNTIHLYGTGIDTGITLVEYGFTSSEVEKVVKY